MGEIDPHSEVDSIDGERRASESRRLPGRLDRQVLYKLGPCCGTTDLKRHARLQDGSARPFSTSVAEAGRRSTCLFGVQFRTSR